MTSEPRVSAGNTRSEEAARLDAQFDSNDCCTRAGYATYHKHRRGLGRFRVRCWFGRHVFPLHKPHPANGYSPSNYWQCPRCEGHTHYYVVGQHRFGTWDHIPNRGVSKRECLTDGCNKREWQPDDGIWPFERPPQDNTPTAEEHT